ncbi:DNA-binding MarR family transcriptional regulator [Halomonas campaniensis]|uniref:DNA-binding MarR family transcriptional regulator n=1 Tax=Halomonas campaniensis TaxID=213554 RepID=A0A7W5PBC2_9GAMM|nr:MarR family transcriptional regulator [Halomonas campaniensis]MBB3331744.1 DNA-binding MarR family transcriptional regulator [Halomonas campaniensis]
MAAQDDRSVANRLFFRLFQASNILQKQTVSAVGLTTVQWAVLGALSRRGYEGGIAFNDLVEYLIVSRQSLDGVLKRLEREGHVRRIPHPDDGRARLILLTDQGRAYWKSLQPQIHDFYAQGLKSLGFDETVSLLHYLNKLQKDLEAIQPITTREAPPSTEDTIDT